MHTVSSGPRIPYQIASDLAHDVSLMLSMACVRIEIAGSIRREAATVGDIEIVAIPKLDAAPTNLFGEPIGEPYDRLHEQCVAHLGCGSFVPRKNRLGHEAIGRKLKWMTLPTGRSDYPSIGLDIYACEPEQWGVTMAVRTGDAQFSRKLVTPRSRGGHCPDHLRFKGWRVIERKTLAQLDTPEESDVFAAIGLQYIDPISRCLGATT